MNEEILKRIDALAEKFGTTAEYLWTVLVADIQRRGVALAIFCCVAMAAAAIVLVRAYRSLLNESRLPEDKQSEAVLVGGTVAVSLAGIAFIVCLSVCWDGLSDAMAPHREALRLILGK